MKLYIKNIENCQECPYYCDEGGWCRHPSRIMKYHVITQWWKVADDCPLPNSKGSAWCQE